MECEVVELIPVVLKLQFWFSSKLHIAWYILGWNGTWMANKIDELIFWMSSIFQNALSFCYHEILLAASCGWYREQPLSICKNKGHCASYKAFATCYCLAAYCIKQSSYDTFHTSSHRITYETNKALRRGLLGWRERASAVKYSCPGC